MKIIPNSSKEELHNYLEGELSLIKDEQRKKNENILLEIEKLKSESFNFNKNNKTNNVNNIEKEKFLTDPMKKQIKDMVGDNEREVYCDHLTAKRDKRGAIRITRRN